MGHKVRERIARIRRRLRNSCSWKTASSYNREPARQSAERPTVTDDYDFRASERRRARELDELEARRLRARERQRAQLRAAHRRRRLTVLGVLGLVVGVASGAWVWTSGTPKARQPIVPAKTVAAPAQEGRAHDARVHARHPRVGAVGGQARQPRQVLATPGLNLIQLDVKDESGEVSGLGARTPALAMHAGADARLLRPRAHHAARARSPHLGRCAHRQLQGPDRRQVEPQDRDPRRARRHLERRRRHPWLNQYNPAPGRT